MAVGRNEASPTLTVRAVDRKGRSGMPSSGGALRTLVFDEVLDGVLIADDDRRYVDANAAACALFGVPRGDLLGHRIEDFVEDVTGVDPVAAWNRFLARGHDAGEFLLVRPDGTRVMVEYRAKA